MKLIYLVNIRLPTEKAHGIETMKLCEAFAKEGLKVELIYPFRFNPIKEDPFDYYKVSRDFKIKKIFHIDLIPLDRLLGPSASWLGSLIFAFNSFCYVLFRNYPTKEKIFFSHDHFPLFGISFLSKNIFWDVHDFPRLKTFFHRFYYSLFFKRLKGIIVTNSWKREELKKIFEIEDKKILVCPNGVDIEMFNVRCSMMEAREKLGLPLDKKIVLYTGHLYSWKGVTTLLEVAWKSKIKNQESRILFVFVGGTEKDIKSFKQKAEGLNNVMIVGHRAHSEIPYWLKSADVLVLPNTAKEDISKYWTSPLKMFEYMASKRPIVASDLPSIREILNENNSVLVKPDDPEALAQGIEKVLENPGLAEKISNQALQNVQQYTWQKRAKKIINFAEEILRV